MLQPHLQSTDLKTPCFSDPDVRASSSGNPGVLADIYQDSHNIAIWQRRLTPALQLEMENIIASGKSLQIADVITSQNCLAETQAALNHIENTTALAEDIAKLVEMFCSLFDLKQAGLRLATLDSAMCPRFHVDRVPCRLVTTYFGSSTEWLPHQRVDHTKLGHDNNPPLKENSGKGHSRADIQQLSAGDVALLKGVLWEGNEHAGLVHRSPTLDAGDTRLLLTLDFLS